MLSALTLIPLIFQALTETRTLLADKPNDANLLNINGILSSLLATIGFGAGALNDDTLGSIASKALAAANLLQGANDPKEAALASLLQPLINLSAEKAPQANGNVQQIDGKSDVADQPVAGDEGIGPGMNPGLNFIASGESKPLAYNKFSQYNAVLGDGKFGLPPKLVSEMTLAEILQYGLTLRQRSGALNSSAVGKYQIVGTTLRTVLIPSLNLSNSNIFDAALQDRMAYYLMKKRGRDAVGLRDEWQSLKKRTDAEILNAYDEAVNYYNKFGVDGPVNTPGPANNDTVNSKPSVYVGPYVGINQQCASLTKALCPAIGHASQWLRGNIVQGGAISQGMPVATFNGSFGGRPQYGTINSPGGEAGKSHTGIYLGQDSGGIYLYNQWNGSGAQSKLGAVLSYYPWAESSTGNADEGGSKYYCISGASPADATMLKDALVVYAAFSHGNTDPLPGAPVPDNGGRKVNPQGIDLIKRFEACILYAYDDATHPPQRILTAQQKVEGHLTIGFGHQDDVTPGEVWDQATADSTFDKDLSLYAQQVSQRVAHLLSDNQFAAIVSLAYNIGIVRFGSSSVLKAINRGDLASVPPEILAYHYTHVNGVLQPSNGLAERRRAEVNLWNS